MPTDLAQTFRTLFKKRNGTWQAFLSPEEHDSFLAKVSSSLVSKTWSTALTQADLWTVPKTSLLLSESVLVSGSALGPKFRVTVLQPKGNITFTLPQTLHDQIKGKPLSIGYGYADAEILDRWFADAATLIDSGQLIYLPERILMVNDMPGHWKAERLDPTEKWAIMKPYFELQKNSHSLVTVEGNRFDHSEIADIMGINIPVIEAMSLSGFSQFLDAEGDSVILLRSAIRKALQEAARISSSSDAPPRTNSISQIRNDLVEPAIAQLNIRYRNVIRAKAFGTAGATVSTLALSLGMWLNPSIAGCIALLGSSGLIASMKEYDDYTKQLGAMEENAWHLLWRLRRNK